ncbi:hypothetical protein GGR57DRAFT_505758 [Xylariaceae sp. FL1272]|nr:hypothetical protein GGR57DRAFT_505758 [Xylariaceae sp. FL1272]
MASDNVRQSCAGKCLLAISSPLRNRLLWCTGHRAMDLALGSVRSPPAPALPVQLPHNLLLDIQETQEPQQNLQPPGFDVEIAAYQLHAIDATVAGCLGDAMGLGKTTEGLSTFAIFAMIKANHEEVAGF